MTKPSGWNGDQIPGKNLTDGNPNSMAHTSCGDVPWMMVDLGRERTVWRVRVRNRVDCCQDRIGGTWVEVLAADGKTVVYTSAPFTGTAGVYEVVPTLANPAADLGAFGIGPWGGGAKFVDPLARWIWSRSDAASWAPAGGDASLVATQGGRVLTRTDGTWTWKSPC